MEITGKIKISNSGSIDTIQMVHEDLLLTWILRESVRSTRPGQNCFICYNFVYLNLLCYPFDWTFYLYWLQFTCSWLSISSPFTNNKVSFISRLPRGNNYHTFCIEFFHLLTQPTYKFVKYVIPCQILGKCT